MPEEEQNRKIQRQKAAINMSALIAGSVIGWRIPKIIPRTGPAMATLCVISVPVTLLFSHIKTGMREDPNVTREMGSVPVPNCSQSSRP